MNSRCTITLSTRYPGLVKVIAHVGANCDPDLRDDVDVSSVVAKVSKYIAERLPGIDAEGPAILETLGSGLSIFHC